MKRFAALLLALAVSVAMTACQSRVESLPQDTTERTQSDAESLSELSPDDGEPEQTASDGTTSDDDRTNVLVAYFSATGTTEGVAENIAAGLNADLYEIVPQEPYTDADLNYNDDDSRSTIEMNDPDARPAISGSVENMEQYDIVFIGYPIWWGEAPRIVSTFIESYDFSGKTVVTFSTSGGSGHNDRSIKELASGANWVTGARLKSNSSQSDVADWITGLGLDITVK